MGKVTPKEMGLTLLLGTGVVVLTPIVAGFLGTTGLEFLDKDIIKEVLTIGTTISAGISAFAVQWAIERFIKK
jgi:hypothetical protein